MNRPRRLPALRLVRIGGWTTAATAAVAVVMTRFAGAGEVPAVPSAEPGPAIPVVMTTTTGAALPGLPARGLLVLHLSSTPGVPAVVATATTAPVPAPSVPVAQPVTTTTVTTVPPVTSSGS